ncbi:hypothetical protein EDC96DRAFT_571402 [Choanephora cucurbitarum]|nr:hypothetical protein EDC96DRAFT_571402 [Choanephora cucurbitarum]
MAVAREAAYGVFWNRDVNAAANIKSILAEYIFSGCVRESRAAILTWDQQDHGL